MSLLTQARARKVVENPFFGLKETLAMMQQLPKVKEPKSNDDVDRYLNAAWKEIQALPKGERKLQAIELFYSILFSIGDINNRQHNLFGNEKIDGGGNSSRKAFRYCLAWILKQDDSAFYTFMPLIAEFTTNENLLFYQITSDRWKGKIQSIEKLNVDLTNVAKYFASRLKDRNTKAIELTLLAKFMPKVPTSARYTKMEDGKIKKRQKQEATKKKDATALRFIEILSGLMGWEVIKYDKNTKFKGYENFRKTQLVNTEAHLFSTGLIKDLDRTQFFTWLNELPSGARYRVQTRLLGKEKGSECLFPKDKWINKFGENMGKLYQSWMDEKTATMERLKKMTPDEINQMDKKEFRNLTKTAKLNTGADNLMDVVIDFFKNTSTYQEMDLKAESILNKIKIGVPTLVIGDRSGSMDQQGAIVNGVHVKARDMMILAITVFLMKNPNVDLRDFFLLFSSECVTVSGGKNFAKGPKPSRWETGKSYEITGSLIDDTKPFSYNYERIRGLVEFNELAHNTDLASITKGLKAWVEQDENTRGQKIEMIQKYQVWLIISDGDVNNGPSPAASMARVQQELKQWFNAEPVMVIWDVKNEERGSASKFENMENVMYFGSFNYQVLNQILTNIDDLDIIDVYTSLQALHRSNRYQVVRNTVQRLYGN